MAAEAAVTFAEHIQELRKRLMWSLFFVAIGAGVGYVLHNKLLILLQHPLHQKLYYTTPTGAFSFIIKVCTVFGLIVALPAVLYHGFAFFQPLIKNKTKRAILTYVFLSVFLACLGIMFAYFISLPAALNFLVHFGSDGGIQSLITANEYFNFVLAYIAGFAVLFQLPLIISFINRVTPLTPSKLMGGTRYVVLGSFVIAAIITPTPDPFNQALMAGPIILLYFVSACVVVLMNRQSRRRARRAREAVPVIDPASITAAMAAELAPSTPPRPAPSRPMAQAPVQRKPVVIDDMLIANRSRSAPAYRPRSPQPRAAAQTAPQNRPSVRIISDFIPAPE
jgi:sec-independent protein translocase protein TatC